MTSGMPEPAGPDGGTFHLARIGRIQLGLLPLGGVAWWLKSWRAALVFLAGGAVSILMWHLHRFMVAGMLTPSVRRRWAYGGLMLLKLALIVLLLRGMMVCFPLEAIPLVTGILLFVTSILLEAAWLIFRPDENDNC